MTRAPMRIAYVCHWDPFARDGVGRKIRAQAAAWRALGAEVEVFYVSRAFPHDTPQAPRHSTSFIYRNQLLGRAAATLRLGEAVRRWRPDVIYLRYTVLLPPLARLLRDFPTIVEVNTDDRMEYRLRSPLRRAANAMSRRVALGAADGFVGVTPELALHVAPDNRTARRTCVTNGIVVPLDGQEPAPPPPNDRPRLVFLASASDSWNGIDKIVWLASALPEFDFDLVCPTDSISGGRLPANLRAHGLRARGDYEAILHRADVGIGTLALHRKQMSQATPLKVREYLLHGIPVIVGYDDPDLSDGPWFSLRLPNTEDNVRDRLREIREFVRAVAGRRISRSEVRPRIDLFAKERQRLAFLAFVADPGVRAPAPQAPQPLPVPAAAPAGALHRTGQAP